jgi:hypothetical protein
MIIKIIHLFNGFNGMISWWFLAPCKELISVKSECDSDGKTSCPPPKEKSEAYGYHPSKFG